MSRKVLPLGVVISSMAYYLSCSTQNKWLTIIAFAPFAKIVD